MGRYLTPCLIPKFMVIMAVPSVTMVSASTFIIYLHLYNFMRQIEPASAHFTGSEMEGLTYRELKSSRAISQAQNYSVAHIPATRSHIILV